MKPVKASLKCSLHVSSHTHEKKSFTLLELPVPLEALLCLISKKGKKNKKLFHLTEV